MFKLTAIATLSIVFVFLALYPSVDADYPTVCADQDRIDTQNPESPCKWTTQQATSAEYVVEMEYPHCRHSIYLRGLSELPPGGSGRLVRRDLNDRRMSGAGGSDGASLSHHTGSGHLYWEIAEGGVRLHVRDHDEYNRDFNINHDTPAYQPFLRHEGDKVLGRFLVAGHVGYKINPSDTYNTGGYQVVLADLPTVSGLAAHQPLADSCHQQLLIEKNRREGLASVEKLRAADAQALIVLRADEAAKLETETARIAQEREAATERLRVTQDVSEQIGAANQAWIAQLAELKALEIEIQANLNERTRASIETARTIKDEYIAIATIRLTETEYRVNLLNDWYREELVSWQDFEAIATEVFAQIAANEREIETNRTRITEIQTTFDETVTALNERMAALQQQEPNTNIPSATPTPTSGQ